MLSSNDILSKCCLRYHCLCVVYYAKMSTLHDDNMLMNLIFTC